MANSIASTARVYDDVVLGDNVVIEDFCVVGCPYRGMDEQSGQTIIGDNAIIRSHTVIYAGNKIGSGFQTGHKANIRELNNIGDNVSIGTLSVVEHHVEVEDEVRIHSQAFIPEYTTLKKNSWIGPNVVITNAAYPKSPDVKKNLAGPTIGESAVVGANATILPGLQIGASSLVGAGSVVTKDVSSESVVAGNPAKVIKSVSDLPYE